MIEQIEVLRPHLEVNDVAVLASQAAEETRRITAEIEQVADEWLPGRTRWTCDGLNHKRTLFIVSP
jgi:hypothetical protein